jgi:hypothetical protein
MWIPDKLSLWKRSIDGGRRWKNGPDTAYLIFI